MNIKYFDSNKTNFNLNFPPLNHSSPNDSNEEDQKNSEERPSGEREESPFFSRFDPFKNFLNFHKAL